MYEVRETGTDGIDRVVLVTQEIGEVVNHVHTEGFQFIMDIYGVKVFDHTDGRTALARVVQPVDA